MLVLRPDAACMLRQVRAAASGGLPLRSPGGQGIDFSVLSGAANMSQITIIQLIFIIQIF